MYYVHTHTHAQRGTFVTRGEAKSQSHTNTTATTADNVDDDDDGGSAGVRV